MTSLRKYDIPEDLRSASLECQRLRKAGLPIPDDVAAKNREYSRMCRRGRGVQPRRRKYDMPEDVRRAAATYSRLHQKGLPVPDEVLVACRPYWRLISQERYMRSKRIKIKGIPRRLRKAASEYRRLRQTGKPVPDGVLAGWREYQQMRRRARGVKPRQLKYGIPVEIRKAASEYRRLRKAGEPVPDGMLADWREYQRLLRRKRGIKPRQKRDAKPGSKGGARPSRRKYDVPEELREAVRKCRRLRRAGKPIPEPVKKAYCEYQQICNRFRNPNANPRGRRPERGDIPEHLRAAARECSRLRRHGLPIPDDLRELAKQYEQAAKRGRKPGGGPRGRRPVHQDIPARLRQANTEYNKLYRKGEPIPEEVRKSMLEYARLLREARA